MGRELAAGRAEVDIERVRRHYAYIFFGVIGDNVGLQTAEAAAGKKRFRQRGMRHCRGVITASVGGQRWRVTRRMQWRGRKVGQMPNLTSWDPLYIVPASRPRPNCAWSLCKLRFNVS